MKIVTPKRWFPTPKMTEYPTTAVLHATAGASATSSISWLWHLFTNGIRGDEANYHYIISRDGTIYKLTPLSQQAWHAGKSEGPSGTSCNRYSFGIAFANRNDGEAVTKAQTLACEWLLQELKQAYPTLRYLTTHRLVSWGRKSDPKGFNFLDMAHKAGLRPWRKTKKHSWV